MKSFEKKMALVIMACVVTIVVYISMTMAIQVSAFEAEKEALVHETQVEFYNLGQQFAEEELRLSTDLMHNTTLPSRYRMAEKFGELRYRVRQAYNPQEKWRDGESLPWLFKEISNEYALAYFDWKYPAEKSTDMLAVFKAADGNAAWHWMAEVEQKLIKIERLDLRIRKATKPSELEEIRNDFEALKAEVQAELKKGPPK